MTFLLSSVANSTSSVESTVVSYVSQINAEETT